MRPYATSVCAVGSLQELMRVDPTAASAVAGWSKTVSTLLEENTFCEDPQTLADEPRTLADEPRLLEENTFCEETVAQDASGGGGRGSAEEGKVEEEGEGGEGGEEEGRAPFIASKLLALLVQTYNTDT